MKSLILCLLTVMSVIGCVPLTGTTVRHPSSDSNKGSDFDMLDAIKPCPEKIIFTGWTEKDLTFEILKTDCAKLPVIIDKKEYANAANVSKVTPYIDDIAKYLEQTSKELEGFDRGVDVSYEVMKIQANGDIFMLRSAKMWKKEQDKKSSKAWETLLRDGFDLTALMFKFADVQLQILEELTTETEKLEKKAR